MLKVHPWSKGISVKLLVLDLWLLSVSLVFSMRNLVLDFCILCKTAVFRADSLLKEMIEQPVIPNGSSHAFPLTEHYCKLKVLTVPAIYPLPLPALKISGSTMLLIATSRNYVQHLNKAFFLE